MPTSQKVEKVEAYSNAVENLHSKLYEAVKDNNSKLSLENCWLV